MHRRDSGPGPGAVPLLRVIGLGPGHAALLTPQAREALEAAEAVVGYGRYLDLLPAELLAGKQTLTTGMTGEMERCRQAIALAKQGRPTVVVSGGDPGVYGMAGLVLELQEQDPEARGLEVEVVPGVPAVTAAAALLGAPLVHDFAVVSLSDLLTPWERIERRLEHAALADFVLAVYNPRSRRRDWQLARAREILLRHKPPQTAAGLVRQAYREGQELWTGSLEDLDPARADMLTICIIGNEATRMIGERMVTPRGYFAKYGGGDTRED